MRERPCLLRGTNGYSELWALPSGAPTHWRPARRSSTCTPWRRTSRPRSAASPPRNPRTTSPRASGNTRRSPPCPHCKRRCSPLRVLGGGVARPAGPNLSSDGMRNPFATGREHRCGAPCAQASKQCRSCTSTFCTRENVASVRAVVCQPVRPLRQRKRDVPATSPTGRLLRRS